MPLSARGAQAVGGPLPDVCSTQKSLPRGSVKRGGYDGSIRPYWDDFPPGTARLLAPCHSASDSVMHRSAASAAPSDLRWQDRGCCPRPSWGPLPEAVRRKLVTFPASLSQVPSGPSLAHSSPVDVSTALGGGFSRLSASANSSTSARQAPPVIRVDGRRQTDPDQWNNKFRIRACGLPPKKTSIDNA
jgi:hypothetical protein